jgi:Na+/glutamate symporter
MADNKAISMKSLNTEKKSSKIKIIILTFFFTALFMMAGKYVYEGITEQNTIPNAPTITLDAVIIAYAPETKSIVFLDRKTGRVEFTLSDSVSLAIFALKSGEIVADYNSKVTK